MEDKELKKRLRKIPDVDKNGDPICKIDESKKTSDNKISKTTNPSKK